MKKLYVVVRPARNSYCWEHYFFSKSDEANKFKERISYKNGTTDDIPYIFEIDVYDSVDELDRLGDINDEDKINEKVD